MIYRVAKKHWSLSAFLQAAIIPARHCAYVFLSMGDTETIQRIGCFRAAFKSVRGIFPELSSRIVAKKAITCDRSGFGMSSFFAKKVEIMHRGFTVMPR